MRKKIAKVCVDIVFRTIKTMCQTAVGVIGSAVVISDIDLKMLVSATCVAGFTCILMNISNLQVGDNNDK